MIYQGSCHCGKIDYEVEREIGEVIACNCSICQRRGHVLTFVPRGKLNLQTPEENLAINVRCLEDVDIATLNIKHFDGCSL